MRHSAHPECAVERNHSPLCRTKQQCKSVHFKGGCGLLIFSSTEDQNCAGLALWHPFRFRPPFFFPRARDPPRTIARAKPRRPDGHTFPLMRPLSSGVMKRLGTRADTVATPGLEIRSDEPPYSE